MLICRPIQMYFFYIYLFIFEEKEQLLILGVRIKDAANSTWTKKIFSV